MAGDQEQPIRQPPRPDRGALITFYLYSLLRIVIVGIIVILGIYFGITRPLEITAGKTTSISIVYNAILGAKLEVILPWTGTIFFGGLWVYERRLRKTSVAREHRRVADLEKQLDPHRTTSGLKE